MSKLFPPRGIHEIPANEDCKKFKFYKNQYY